MYKPSDDDLKFMRYALRVASIADKYFGEVPVGSIAVKEGKIIAAGLNRPITSKDPTAHAEITAIRRAAHREGAYRIPNVDLYVTLEPCTMCIGAIIHARIRRLFYSAPDPKVGVISTGVYQVIEKGLNHKLEIFGGLLADESSSMLKDFFFRRRKFR
ncbi:MAG: nucleoside deaminase [Acidobacteria bacterium]|nr:nucleoside deaminase [Acidobacteriota bacterium]